MLGIPSNILTGVDYYDATYHSNRSEFNGFPPIHVYDLNQQTLAGYWQQTIGLLPTTDFSYGARVQNTILTARDRFDPNAPGAFDTQANPLDSNETQYARILESSIASTRFSRCSAAPRAHSARPTVDERVRPVPPSMSSSIRYPETSR